MFEKLSGHENCSELYFLDIFQHFQSDDYVIVSEPLGVLRQIHMWTNHKPTVKIMNQ